MAGFTSLHTEVEAPNIFNGHVDATPLHQYHQHYDTHRASAIIPDILIEQFPPSPGEASNPQGLLMLMTTTDDEDYDVWMVDPFPDRFDGAIAKRDAIYWMLLEHANLWQ